VKKKVLVVGENSYIAKSFEKFCGDDFDITLISSRDSKWEKVNFSGYEALLYCAAIVHQKQKKELKNLYYDINTDLPVKVALKAKKEGVPQFVFLSTMAVYGTPDKEIRLDTPPCPDSSDMYAISKIEAEYLLESLVDENFHISTLRPPMVYGFGCEGNFPKLVSLAKHMSVFPTIDNKRSMIYIENLCACIKLTINEKKFGLQLPQNIEYVDTKDIVNTVRKLYGKKTKNIRLFNGLIKALSKKNHYIGKIFGSKAYAHDGSEEIRYNEVAFKESIRRSIHGVKTGQLNVTIITSYYHPEVTAPTYIYAELAEDFSKYGANVTVACGIPSRLVSPEISAHYAKNPIEHNANGLKVMRVGPQNSERGGLVRRGFYHLRRSYAIYRAAKKVQTDIYVLCSTPPFMGIAGGFLAKLAPTIYGVQDIFPDSWITIKNLSERNIIVRILRRIERKIYEKNTRLHTISGDMKNTLLSRGVPESKITVVENWCDTRKCTPVLRSDNILVERFGLNEKEFIVSYAGNIGLLQNIDTIVKAAALIEKLNKNIKFVIIGDGANKNKVKAMIDSMNISNVKMFPMQPHDEISYIYSLGDIEIISLKKGMTQFASPSKLMNILSAGRPLICEVDKGSDIVLSIEENNLGRCFAPGNADAMAKIILEMYRDKENLAEMGARNRAYAENNFQRDEHTKKLYELVCKVAALSYAKS
jgi:UDP-glucose 4-epimerase